MKFGLDDKTLRNFGKVFDSHPQILEVIVYGSRAKGNFREGSDIDLTLKGPKVTEELRKRVWLELDALNSPYLIDLSVYHLLDSRSLLDHIDRIGQVFYSKSRQVDVP